MRRLMEKFICSSIGIFAGFVANLFFANAVDPETYGEYGFIIAACTFITQIVFVTLNEAYIFNLSNNRYAISQVNTAYLILLSIITILSALWVIITLFLPIRSFFWPNIHNALYVVFGFIYILFLNIQQGMVKYADCTSQSVTIEKLRLLSKVIVLPQIGLLWVCDSLNLTTYLISLLVSLLFFYSSYSYKYTFPMEWPKQPAFKEVLMVMYKGWGPLAFYPLLDAIYAYGGRYILQDAGGGLQQGLYSYALFLATIPVAALSPMVTIYMNHMSKMYSQNSYRLKSDYLAIYKVAILLYGAFSFFVYLHAEEIVILLGNPAYYDAAASLKWLVIFSFLHVFGLLDGNFYFCTERTSFYRRITNITNIIGILLLISLFFTMNMDAVTLSMVMVTIYGIKTMSLFANTIRFLKINRYEFLYNFSFPIFTVLIVGLFLNKLLTSLVTEATIFFTMMGIVWLFYFHHVKKSMHLNN